MAVHYPIVHPAVYPVELHINYTFDRLIFLLNKRRAELLKYVRDTREDKRAAERERLETISQLIEAQEQLHKELRQNILQPLKTKWNWILKCKKRESLVDIPVEVQFQLKCVTRELERNISRLGEVVEVPVYVPHYATCHTRVVATGKQGRAPVELYYIPYGVATHEEIHQIFVVNRFSSSVEKFSETGEFFHQLGVGQLSEPYGIAIYGDSIYVSCWDHTVSKFSLTEMCHVRRIGDYGSNNGQFKFPRQLTTDPISRVFIADTDNHRICIHDPDLNHLRNISSYCVTTI